MSNCWQPYQVLKCSLYPTNKSKAAWLSWRPPDTSLHAAVLNSLRLFFFLSYSAQEAKTPYMALFYSYYTEIPSSAREKVRDSFSCLLMSKQPVKFRPAAALWTLFAEFCSQSLADCQRKPFSLWELCKDVMGRLPGSQSAGYTVE